MKAFVAGIIHAILSMDFLLFNNIKDAQRLRIKKLLYFKS